MGSRTDLIRQFIEAWSRLDPKELASYFDEDGVYHNMPMGPVRGRDRIEELIRGFTASWTETHWEIVSMAESGNRVFAERVDHIRAGEKTVELPCLGVFETEGGKIKAWRDYFDLGTYSRALG